MQLGIHSTHADRWKTFRVPLPHGLIFVLFIPQFVGKTEELRKVVPKEATKRVCGPSLINLSSLSRFALR